MDRLYVHVTSLNSLASNYAADIRLSFASSAPVVAQQSLVSDLADNHERVNSHSACIRRLTFWSHVCIVAGSYLTTWSIPWFEYGFEWRAWERCTPPTELCESQLACRLVELVSHVRILTTGGFVVFAALYTFSPSHYFSRARMFFYAQWATHQLSFTMLVLESCANYIPGSIRLSLFVAGIGTLSCVLLLLNLLTTRVSKMEHSMGISCHAELSRRLFRFLIVSLVVGFCLALTLWVPVFAGAVTYSDGQYRNENGQEPFILTLSKLASSVNLIAFVFFFLSSLTVAIVAFRTPVRILVDSVQKIPTAHEQMTIIRAARVARRSFLWVTVCGVSSALMLLSGLSYAYRLIPVPGPVFNVVVLIDVMANSICIVYTSGLCRKSVAGEESTASMCSSAEEWAGTGHGSWDEHVLDLGNRGVYLEALLDFWQQLGRTCMHHFDPRRHRTSDVVRLAVIPLSAVSPAGPCALSTVLMGGERCLANRMITHTWDNLFAHLVAAAVADALDAGEYETLLIRLEPPHINQLLVELRQKDLLKITYWICALCVNQHKAICGNNPNNDKDPVTQVPHTICKCGQPKILNTTEPVRADGESVFCELNKFDDMLSYLATQGRDFRHVIAVDERFRLFDRAWCIAEIYQGNQSAIRQVLRFHSSASFQKHVLKLKRLKVEHMKASRDEDKEMILRKIGDVDTFNKKLRHVICDQHTGLIHQWMDAYGDATLVGKAVALALHYARKSHASRSGSDVDGEMHVRDSMSNNSVDGGSGEEANSQHTVMTHAPVEDDLLHANNGENCADHADEAIEHPHSSEMRPTLEKFVFSL